MKLYSVHDKEFAPYGKVLDGYDTATLAEALENETPLPATVEYLASASALERLAVAEKIRLNTFGCMLANEFRLPYKIWEINNNYTNYCLKRGLL